MVSKWQPVEIIRHFCREMQPVPTGVKPKLGKLKGIRAVVFDIYGTLFQSAAGDIALAAKKDAKIMEKAAREALDAAGFLLNDEVSPIAELFIDTVRAELDIRKADGVECPEVDIMRAWEDVLEQLEAFEVVRGKVSKHSLMQLALHYEVRVNPVYPMPGVMDVINSVLDHGAKMGVISNAQAFTPLLFEAFFEDNPKELGFDEELLIWSYQYGQAKPGRALFETCADRLTGFSGINPEQTLYIGNDMRNDIVPAARVGFKTALFAGDKRSLRMRENDPACQQVKPDLVITKLEQVSDCLAG